MPGILYVVATPIGNLEDVTLRALRILREVSLIAAEDTRRTAKLLQHYSITTPTTSLHEHNERARTPGLLERLKQGDSIALVSDAGTPGISDPGGRLLQAAHESGIAVQPVPGPSAITALMSAIGAPEQGFVFAGFAPSRATHRERWLASLKDEGRPVVFYEAPHRILATLEAVQTLLGDRIVAIGRELTKLHESLGVRPISAWLSGPPPAQGEFVVAVLPAALPSRSPAAPIDEAAVAAEFGHLTETVGLSRREAIHAISQRLNLRSRDVFSALEQAKNSAE